MVGVGLRLGGDAVRTTYVLGRVCKTKYNRHSTKYSRESRRSKGMWGLDIVHRNEAEVAFIVKYRTRHKFTLVHRVIPAIESIFSTGSAIVSLV